jgi:hypothetical protein
VIELLQVFVLILFLSYRIKKLKEVFEFKLLLRSGSSNTPISCSVKLLWGLELLLIHFLPL